MTYPLTALLEANWGAVKTLKPTAAKEDKLAMEVGLTEVTACAERALNFMHTGNPAVIKTSVMNPLWIGRAIIHDGLPSFNPNIVKVNNSGTTHVIFGEWPYDGIRKLPKSTSERAIRYRYNELTVGVSVLLYVSRV
jgi:hypothetical protein